MQTYLGSTTTSTKEGGIKLTFKRKHSFEVRHISGEKYGLHIIGDLYPNARAIIYGDWIANELAAQLNEVNKIE